MRNTYKVIALNTALVSSLSLFVAGCDRYEAPHSLVPSTTIGTEIDDSLITTKVKSALLNSADIKSFDLKVETHKGDVQLSGFVNNQTQIDRAIETARVIEGVKKVSNNMSVKSGNVTVGNNVDDSVVTTKVKSALLADLDVKSFDIAVLTRKGKVQLSGFVDNQTQIDHAIDITRGIEGVRSVENEMRIKK